jgi:arsenate reductase
MAEAFFNRYAHENELAESAGIEPGDLNQYVVRAMEEKGFDISGNKTKCIFELYKEGHHFSHVISVCDEEVAEQCPVFPGVLKNVHWNLKDPSTFVGSDEEIMQQIRAVRDSIEERVKAYLSIE